MNTEVGCHVVLQGIFLTQGLNPGLLWSPALAGDFFTTNITWEAPILYKVGTKNIILKYTIDCRVNAKPAIFVVTFQMGIIIIQN